ncbi:MAG: ATP-dependent helicase [Hyphomonadaceae bacterium]
MSRISARQKAFDELNPEQLAAVEHNEGPLLVIAGAGSGKTKTLSCRVARLVRDGADPHRILLLTFSRRAATDMVRRVGIAVSEAIGVSDTHIPWAGTFHSIGARLLRELAPITGLSSDFTIHDRSDSADLMGMMRQELGFTESSRRFPRQGTCLAIYSRAINAEEAIGEAITAAAPWCRGSEVELEKLFQSYVSAKQAQSVLDYDDLLYLWAELMSEPALAQEVSQRFDHVLVDEYQDTNKLQSRILLALKPSGRGLTVVGDDVQSIYGFRAATVRNILDFPKQFSPEARIVTLEENYRSTAPILVASNSVIDLAAERFTKNLRTTRSDGQKPRLVTVRDETDQARYVADHILEARERGVALTQQAVLFRASDFSAQVELELQRRDVPFVKFGGLKFLEAAHVKDFLAILRWAQNGSDRLAGFRTLQLVPGVGPTRAARILDAMREDGAFGAVRDTAPPTGASQQWEGLKDLLRSLSSGGVWSADLEAVARWYAPILETHYDDARVRIGDIDQLLRIGATYETRSAFLAELTLDPPTSTADEASTPHKDDDYVILSTIHSAKGQEWRCVHILNVVDGCMPADLGVGSTAELEEERRLLYVAMTRAKDELHLIVPQRFYHTGQARNGDRSVFAQRSRFLPPTTLTCFDQIGWSPALADANATASTLAPIDLQARARGRWSR